MTAVIPSTPLRTDEQRHKALAVANETRTYRSQLKHGIATGRASFLAVLASPEPMVETMKLVELLLAVPGIGRVKANQILRVTGTSPSRTLGGLSDRQRLEVASAARERMRPAHARSSKEPR